MAARKDWKKWSFSQAFSKENVNYVKDFLTLLYLEPTRLRNILGTSMSAKVWDATVNHARTCELDNKLYLYHSSGSQQKKVVVFNVVGRVMGLFSNNQLISSEKLSATDKADAHGLVLSAFKHWDKVVSVDDEASLMHAYCSLPTLDYLNPRLVANFENNKSLAANTYGFGDNPGFTSSSTARMEGQFSIDDEASSNTDSSSNPPVMANFDGHKISTANANCNGENPELSSSLTAQMEGWSSVDDEASLILVPYCLPTVDYFSNPPVMANFDGNKSLSAGTFDNGDYPELSSSSTAQVEGVFSSDDYSRKNDLDFGNDQPSSNSILDIDSKIQVLLEDEMLRKFNPDYNHLHSSIFRSLNEPQCVLSGALKHPVPPSKGHRRWKMLLSAVRKISLGN